MTRWNIVNIFFLGVSGQRRDVTLSRAFRQHHYWGFRDREVDVN